MSSIFSFTKTLPTFKFWLCNSNFHATKKLRNVTLEEGTNILTTNLVYVAERTDYDSIGSFR